MTSPPAGSSRVTTAPPEGAECGLPEHAGRAAVATCERCGTFVCAECLREGPLLEYYCAGCAPRVEHTPWERREVLGFRSAFAQTAKGTLFSPTAFFEARPASLRYVPAVWWAVLCGVVGEGCFFLYHLLAARVLGPDLTFDLFGSPAPSGRDVVVFLSTPIRVPIQIAIGAGAAHLVLKVLRGATRAYETTFRTMAYCWTVALFNVIPIPVLAFLVVVLWGFVIQIVGLSVSQGCSRWKAAIAVLVPGLCFLCFGMAREF